MKKELGVGLIIIGIVTIISVAVADIKISINEKDQNDNSADVLDKLK